MMNTLAVKNTLPPQNCSGCAACANICSRSAISMIYDDYGFLKPSIDKDKCIQCGMCERICPWLNEIKNPKEVSLVKAFAAQSLNIVERLNSSSGGIFSLLANKILNAGGVVAGVTESKGLAKHILIDSAKKMDLIRGSKYLQSNPEYIYRLVKNALNSNRKVLFSGTPCQVAALYAFLGKKEYQNLYTVDLVCHGVPSKFLYNKYKSEIEDVNKVIQKNLFRDKKFGWKLFSMTNVIEYSKGNCFQKITSHHKENPYMQLFLSDICLNECCFNCRYAKLPRIADISLGDFWAVKSFLKDMDDDKGTSLILLNNEKGEALFKSIESNEIKIREVDFESVKKTAPRIYSASPKVDLQKRVDFFSEIKSNSITLKSLASKYGKKNPLIKKAFYQFKKMWYTFFPIVMN